MSYASEVKKRADPVGGSSTKRTGGVNGLDSDEW